MESNLVETKLSSELIYDGKILHVYKDQVTLPNGHAALREVMRHVGAVCMVALTEDNRVAVERQYRYPVGQVITEIPAGKLDSKEEDHEEAAKRELWEETGITAKSWQYLGTIYPAAAYTDEVLYIYLARDLSFGERHLDEDEFLDVEFVKIEDVVEEIMAGKIPDSKTQVSILRVYHMLQKGLI
ncbi:MAG: NUDIX hydrolase [Oscillospiraceae bacterium]|nr:NUDIX hydrolase [Oscillospiraceae bacterium]